MEKLKDFTFNYEQLLHAMRKDFENAAFLDIDYVENKYLMTNNALLDLFDDFPYIDFALEIYAAKKQALK